MQPEIWRPELTRLPRLVSSNFAFISEIKKLPRREFFDWFFAVFCGIILKYPIGMALIIVFVFGIVLGSFLNVLILRFYSDESVLVGRSHCTNCRHVLGVWDLLPLVSFFILGRKCRYCGKKISWQYPAVELATGILFSAACLILNFNFQILDFKLFNLLWMWFVICVMIVVFVYDLKYYLILDKVIYPAAVAALFVSPFVFGTPSWRNFAGAVIAAAIGGGFFLLQYLLSHGKWIGGGDIKLGALMGLILGVGNLFVALFFAYVIGAIFGIFLVAAKKKTMQSQIPFGTFLAVGTMVALFWGEKIIQWYWG